LDPLELYHEAVFEKNRGNIKRALELLALAAEGPDGDGRVQYLAACCHALEGRMDDALECMKKAVRASPQNRIQARLETDLGPLRGTPAFTQLLTRA
jgi:tetratricopeptide (TPR) repeat protein